MRLSVSRARTPRSTLREVLSETRSIDLRIEVIELAERVAAPPRVVDPTPTAPRPARIWSSTGCSCRLSSASGPGSRSIP
jgi:hypothetical protein